MYKQELPQNNSFLKGINTTPINETVIANAMQIKLSESMNINMVDFINIYAAKFRAGLDSNPEWIEMYHKNEEEVMIKVKSFLEDTIH